MPRIEPSRRGFLLIGALAATVFAAVLVVSMMTAPAASAQQPSICDEYPELPECNPGPEPPGPGPGPGPDGGPGGPSADQGAGEGELPFTGYPLTPLLLLLLLLLLLGLAIRTYLAVRDHLRERQSPATP